MAKVEVQKYIVQKYGVAGGQSVLVHFSHRVCWGTSMMPWVLASTNSVLGGRVARRSLLSGTLGGRALNMIGFYSSFGSVVIMRCEDAVASMVTMRSKYL